MLADTSGSSLTWDGSTAALSTWGAVPPQADYDQEDLYWLSRIISAESRGEPLVGQIAVGNVVLNRTESGQFPDTVKEVVFDSQYAVQFTPVANGTIYLEPAASSVLAAKLCLEGAEVAGDSLYFFARRCPPAAGSPRTGPTLPPSAATTSTAERNRFRLSAPFGVWRGSFCAKNEFSHLVCREILPPIPCGSRKSVI